ncbi:MAG: acyltransferase [Pseudomonadota bacterium]
MDRPNPRHIPQLDALRGIAALMVLVSHSANAQLLPSYLGNGFGRMGVGLFFVLSAFLLTTLYAGKRPDASAVWHYSVKRVARVLPLFYAALAGSWAMVAVTGISIFSAFDTLEVFLGNALLISGTSVLWSIPVEIHFYVCFIGFWILAQIRTSLGIAFLVALQIALLVIAEFFEFRTDSLPYWMHFFTFGVVLALLAERHWSFVSSHKLFALGPVIAVLATPVLLPGLRADVWGLDHGPIFRDPITVSWIFLFSAAFVFAFIPTYFLQSRVFKFLGEVSFSVYLFHLLPIWAFTTLIPKDIFFQGDRFVCVLVVTLLGSYFITRLFERPAQRFIVRALNSKKTSFAT